MRLRIELSQPLPICEVIREDPARPPLARRVKHLGMRMGGRLATVLRHVPRQQPGDEFGILIYHRVAPATVGCAPPTFNVPPDRFRDQIVGLRQQGFNFLPLQEVLQRRANGDSLPPRTTVITFDDGFESVYEFAWPTLGELKLPATIFLNTAYLDQQTPFPFDAWGQAYIKRVPPVHYRPLTVGQCAHMSATGLIELGAHTHTHADFRTQTHLFRNDMQVCLQHLQDVFGITTPTFAFPFGKPCLGFAQQKLVDIARELALPCSLTTEAIRARLTDSPFTWGRFNAYDWDTAQTLAAKLLGYYSWAPRLAEGVVQKWKQRRRPATRRVSA
jgi:peptidoglycan/xylan/chitin deacetylase (PgdA/CDA1 family)